MYIHHIYTSKHPLNTLYTPKYTPLYQWYMVQVRSIGAGFYNTLVACKSGALFCGGENQNRQCGRDPSLGADQSNLHYMARATDFEGYHIVEASGGYCHTLALTDTGRVLSIGCGDDGQVKNGFILY